MTKLINQLKEFDKDTLIVMLQAVSSEEQLEKLIRIGQNYEKARETEQLVKLIRD